MTSRSERDSDWGVDPDIDADFPDDATIARALEEDRRRLRPRRRSGFPWRILLSTAIVAFLVTTMVSDRRQRDAWLGLVRAGGGEVRYMATDRACQTYPYLARTWRGTAGAPQASLGLRVEVVARENGWALIDRYGRPCWVPEWSLRRTEPDLPVVRQCSQPCRARAPKGWAEAQRKAACEATILRRVGCFVDGLFRRPAPPV